MKIDFHGNPIPYPLAAIRGRLLLAGLSRVESEDILRQLASHDTDSKGHISLETLAEKARNLVPQPFLPDYDLLRDFETLRRTTSDVPPLILVIEGSSATGKSMLALDFIANLAITRIVSTDTVRQVLRGIHSPEKHPELYCHTYQAHLHRQAGSDEFDPIVRGYLAQCELMEPAIRAAVEGLVWEGTEALVEGVHIIPGSLRGLGPGILEILIHPEEATHRAMFLAKNSASGLKTVSADAKVRNHEFQATRLIQEYMAHLAESNSTQVVMLVDYEQASEEIRRHVLDKIRHLLKGTSGGSVS
jgi:2-phosphoglycerate kinase